MSQQHPTERLVQRGDLRGHGGWVTSIATGSAEAPDVVLSGSRDKSLILWTITKEEDNYGHAEKRLTGHAHYVSDVALSSDGQYALSGSWDGTLRLWNLRQGKTDKRFIGHTKDVLSVAFSECNTKIVSGSRDNTCKIWNTLGACKLDLPGHKSWVSCVRFSPNPNAQTPTKSPALVVSAGWDKVVKVWNLTTCKLRTDLKGHTGYINSVTVSPDGSLCASGGKDGTAMLWDLNDSKHLSSLQADDIIHALTFSPIKYWLCAATASSIKIWDLESKMCVDELKPEFPKTSTSEKASKAVPIQCISLCWSADGNTLFAGYTDNVIRVWKVTSNY